MQNYNKYFDFTLFLCNFVPMKLSIVIPVYRVEATLERCLKSVVGQSFTDFEVILVDDGSPDNCPKLCDEWAGKDKSIRVIHKQNGGLSDARNAGIETARGEFITFVDSDDFLDTNTYEQIMPLAEAVDIVEFPVYKFYGSTRQELLSFTPHTYDDMGDYWLNGRAYIHCYACNKIFRRTLFDDVRFPKGKVFEDVATLPLLLEKTKKVMTTDKGLYYYCANDNGITTKAGGKELSVLLEGHLEAMSRWQDDAYYMEVLNKQMDVYEHTGTKPLLQRRFISPFSAQLTFKQSLKAVMLNILGIKGICKLNIIIHKTMKRKPL